MNSFKSIKFDGIKNIMCYYVNNKLHREDGFAKEWIDNIGNICGTYYLNNKNYLTKQEYCQALKLKAFW